ncbi:hypothetical protein EVAR_81930_1 [Eumeta japonica]|uniref:Uncharacterized protein n=1 Tax=Eumeta variegata TaxID=151549 RepID=A0A4C1UXQ5_EUMVA|nr:hypothetical protein EVAR_81930_1 [Eumeta japonica]
MSAFDPFSGQKADIVNMRHKCAETHIAVTGRRRGNETGNAASVRRAIVRDSHGRESIVLPTPTAPRPHVAPPRGRVQLRARTFKFKR